MGQSISIKVTGEAGVDKLAADIAAAEERLPKLVRPVVSRGALNIKRDWQQAWAGHPTYRHLGAAVTYESNRGTKELFSAEIGPDKDRPQGALGNIIEYGTSKNAPNPGGAPALQREAPRFEKALADAAEQALEL